VKDWVHGIRTEAPDKDTQKAVKDEPLYEAERLRIVYQMVTNPTEEGGAGITPKIGEWKCVESIFALHDEEFNKRWIKELSNSSVIKPKQLDEIRNMFGEQVSLVNRVTSHQRLNGPRLDSTLRLRNPILYSLLPWPSLDSPRGSFSVTFHQSMLL
jgi:hypothetical protein